jgi:hypothetical protein
MNDVSTNAPIDVHFDRAIHLATHVAEMLNENYPREIWADGASIKVKFVDEAKLVLTWSGSEVFHKAVSKVCETLNLMPIPVDDANLGVRP